MMLMKFYNKQRGIGLLELMLSLAIIAILLVMATRYYVITSRSQQANQAVEFVNAMISAARNYSAGGNFNGIDSAGDALIKMGLVSKGDQNKDGTGVINGWGNPVTFTVGTNGGSLTISMTVPTFACVSLNQKLASEDNPAPCTGGSFKFEIGGVQQGTK